VAGERKEALLSTVLRREREHKIAEVMDFNGFSEPDFDLEPGFRLVHKLTEDHFDFGPPLAKDGPRSIRHSVPGTYDEQRLTVQGFDQSIVHFNRWCGQLRQYIKRVALASNLPDLFVSASGKNSPMQALALEPSLENSPLSPGEREMVIQRLEILTTQIQQHTELPKEQFEILGRQIRYLTEASVRLGRKDWLNVFFNVLVSFAIAGIFAPDRVNEMIGYGAALFQFLTNPNLLP